LQKTINPSISPYIIISAVSYCQSPSGILGISHCGLVHFLQSLDDFRKALTTAFVSIGNEFDNA
ncbi:hypothetical protein, partial [Streptococcus pneumoniae]|uniref:hypothetical protein n=1 Tax=Streptococcus pneumoniae TaxID=1313 RepID=UPI001C626B65